MKHPFLIACAVAFIGSGLAAWADNATSHGAPDPETARKMGYRTLANGAVIYEEIPDPAAIEPAAGGEGLDQGAEPSFKYDPLTQTYRRVTVDRAGNSSQDVINTNDQ